MKLYHHPASHNARRAVAMARHLSSPVDFVAVDLGAGEQRSPAYLALNPNGKVPVLVDGDFALWESTAIMTYLAAKAGSPLVPTAPRDRADMDKWIAWTGGRFARPTDTFLFENVIKPFFGIGAPDEATLARARPDVEACFALLDAHLATHPYLAACGLTVADFAAYVIVEARTSWGLPSLEAYPSLARWAASLAAFPCWSA